MDSLNLVTFGMSALSLVCAVVQLAMVSSENADVIYRSYLGKVASCHFALVSSCQVNLKSLNKSMLSTDAKVQSDLSYS